MSDTAAGRAPAVQRALTFEVGIWRSLFRWVLRRPSVPKEGAEPFSYHRMVTPVFWLWIFACVAEIVAVDLMLPWHTARIVAAVLGLWGLAWMLGMVGALKVYPHLVVADGLRVRNSFALDVFVPWEAVATITGQSHDLASSMRSMQIEQSDRGDVLAVGVSGRTNVLLRLHEPLELTTPRGAYVVTAVRLWADDNRDLVARARSLAAPK